jgi:antitoxin Phd
VGIRQESFIEKNTWIGAAKEICNKSINYKEVFKNKILMFQKVKSRFNEFIDRVFAKGVQIVNLCGRKIVTILSSEESKRLNRPFRRLGDFLLSSPLAGLDLEITRDSSIPRDIKLEL